MPRNRLIVPMVTTMEGRPKPATSKPLKAPQASPTPSPMATSAGVPTPACSASAHGGRGKRDDRGDREVDLAGDDQQRHGKRDHRLFGEIEGGVRQVPGVRGNRARRSELAMKIATATATSSASQLPSRRVADVPEPVRDMRAVRGIALMRLPRSVPTRRVHAG